MNKHILLSVASLGLALQSFGLEYDAWAMESNVSPYTATSRYWRVTFNGNGSSSPLITDIESLPGNPDPSTFDSVGLLGMQLKSGVRLSSLMIENPAVSESVSGITTVILSETTYAQLELKGLPNLSEMKTTSEAQPHVISVSTIYQQAFYNSKVAGAYVFKDVTAVKQQAFNLATELTDVRIFASFAGFAGRSAFEGCSKLTHFDCQSSQSLTSICSLERAFCGTAFSAVCFRDATSIGKAAFLSCSVLKEAVFPSVTSFAGTENAFGSCYKLESLVFGSEDTFTLQGKQFHTTARDVSNMRIVFNTKSPAFSGSTYPFDAMNSSATIYVRKNVGWVDYEGSRPFVVEDVSGVKYIRRVAGDTGFQKRLVEMDTAVKLNVQTNGVTVFTTILPGMTGTDATYTVPKLMVLPPEGTMTSVSSLTSGVTAALASGGQGIDVVVPSSLYPEASDSETKDLEVNVSFSTEPQSQTGMIIIVR